MVIINHTVPHFLFILLIWQVKYKKIIIKYNDKTKQNMYKKMEKTGKNNLINYNNDSGMPSRNHVIAD